MTREVVIRTEDGIMLRLPLSALKEAEDVTQISE